MLNLSPKRQLLLLFSFYCFSNVFGSLISIIFLKFNSSQVPKLALSVISGGVLLIPAFIAYKLFSKKELKSYWSLNTPFNTKTFFITILTMVCCILLMNWLAEVNKLIPVFDWMQEAEVTANIILMKYLKMDNIWQLLFNLLVFSLIPSFCEEVFFRGTMQPLWYNFFPKPWIAIFITAFIFSFLHFQFLGFLPRFFAGIVFGVLFYYTGNLWLSIISHVLYNGYIVILNYLDQQSQISLASYESLLLSPFLLISAALIMIILFFQIQKDAFKLYNYNGS